MAEVGPAVGVYSLHADYRSGVTEHRPNHTNDHCEYHCQFLFGIDHTAINTPPGQERCGLNDLKLRNYRHVIRPP